jgi:hypothetical protein
MGTGSMVSLLFVYNSDPKLLQSRQEVCESFEWFRSYQSGVYHANGIVKGYLLSGFPAW